MRLADETCAPVTAGTVPFSLVAARALGSQIPAWRVEEKVIVREFQFEDFRQAMDFVNRVAKLANEQDHHPDILISYNKVRLIFSTHKIGGLSRSDFIMAAKVDVMTP